MSAGSSWRAAGLAWVLALIAAMWLSFAPGASHAEDGLLEQGKAFRFDARVADSSHVEVSFDVAPGYYMYREPFKFAARGGRLGEADIPAGHVKFDETFQKNVETYRGRLLIGLPVLQAAGPFTISVVSQGCSDKGICYPPAENHAEVRLTSADGGPGTVRLLPRTPYMPGTEAGSGVAVSIGSAGGPSTLSLPSRGVDVAGSDARAGDSGAPSGRVNTASPADTLGVGQGIQAALQSGRVASVIGVFLLAGMLLSLTPCVLPMLPILSSIIVGEEARLRHPSSGGGTAPSRSTAWAERRRALALAGAYSLGMALVYTALGVAAGLAGEGLAAALQKPWVLGLFASGLVALSLSMFGLYELQLPSSWTGRVSAVSGRLKGGRVAGVFVMGGLSALIVSPCVAAPLAGALVFISQTRDAWLGGAALFSLAAGMSVPLLLVGVSAGALLPRAGPWMEAVKRVFGVLLLAVAIWTVQPVLPAPWGLALWGALLIFSALALGLFDRAAASAPAGAAFRIRQTLAVLLSIFGLLQLVGAASGGTDPLQPLSHLVRSPTAAGDGIAANAALPFVMIKTTADLDQALRAAGRPVMLDFYADWCVSCKEMDRFTYSDATVKARLAGVLLLKADVTRNAPDDRELLRRFNLFGPPGTLFFDAHGQELQAHRVIGFESAERFVETLRAAGL